MKWGISNKQTKHMSTAQYTILIYIETGTLVLHNVRSFILALSGLGCDMMTACWTQPLSYCLQLICSYSGQQASDLKTEQWPALLRKVHVKLNVS